jgi:hypothetical protein
MIEIDLGLFQVARKLFDPACINFLVYETLDHIWSLLS